jgi:hypothetical protein
LAPAPGGWVNALHAYRSAGTFKRELSDRGLVLSLSYVLPVLLKAALDAKEPAARKRAEQALDEEVAEHAAFLREVGCPTLVTRTIPRAEFSDIEGVDAPSADFDAPTDPELMGEVADQLNRIGQIAANGFCT